LLALASVLLGAVSEEGKVLDPQSLDDAIAFSTELVTQEPSLVFKYDHIFTFLQDAGLKWLDFITSVRHVFIDPFVG
jgi:hypothetical protein